MLGGHEVGFPSLQYATTDAIWESIQSDNFLSSPQ